MKSQYPNPNRPATPRRNIAPPFPILGFGLRASFRISGFGFRVSPAPRRSAFSFAEVMFAVVILGIGFIMIAAIFPVAMQQSQITTDESTAASIARQATNTLSALPLTTPDLSAIAPTPPAQRPSLLMFPPTVKEHLLLPATIPPGMVVPPAVVVSFTGPRWDAIKNNLILPTDNRYAYVPFYRRENGSNVIQLIVVAVAVRNRSTYEVLKDTTFPLVQTPTVTITMTHPNNSATATAGAQMQVLPDTATITTGNPVEGGYVVSNAAYGGVAASPTAGRTYRLGRQYGAPALSFELEPADDTVLGAGPDGVWGTGDDVCDPPGAILGTLWPPNTLQPQVAYAYLDFSAGSPSIAGRITLYGSYSSATGLPSANVPPVSAAPGAFIIVADDYPYDPANPTVANYLIPVNSATFTVGALNGRILRLGQLIPADSTANPPVPPGTYDLDPSYGMRGPVGASPDQTPGTSPRARVFLIGAGRTDPQNPSQGYSGPAQDIAVYTTFIPAQ